MSNTVFTYQGGTTSTSSNTILTSSSYTSASTLTRVQVGTIVTSLATACFQNCSILTSITLPSSVTSLGNSCFRNCTKLPSISMPSSITTLPQNVFRNCTSLTSITLPSEVTTLGNTVFLDCIKLLSIVIPSTVTTLGNSVFQNCTSLTSFEFDNQNNLTTIGTSTFFNDVAMSVTYYNTASQANLSTASASLQTQFPSGSTFTYNAQASCFNKGTKILTEQGYVRIEDLKKGDLVKTYLHGYKGITKIGKGFGKNNNENKVLNMHEFKGIYEEPLIITGGHSMLVNDLGDLKEENEKWFHGGTYKIEDKYLLLATVSKDFKEIKDGSEFEYYHLVLENEDEKGQYGIWANEVLMESASEKWFVKAGLKEV